MAQEWLKMTASDLGRGIEAGKINPVALTQTYLDAIATHDLTQRIYSKVTTERALEEAQAAQLRQKAGKRLSPLDGVPISWKDLFDSAGVATEAGSALLKGRVPEADALVLKQATEAGLVCLGKTHMSELAFSGLGLNPVTETPPCVNDLNAVSGGSSSGAATSVAFDLAAIGIGSDTGGSVRIPSAWNDLVGLKTTSGDVSLDGVVPLCIGFDTVGPLCRSVEDAAAIYDVLKGNPVAPLTAKPVEGLRLLNLTTVAQDQMEDLPETTYAANLETLRKAGAEIEELTYPDLNEAMDLSACLFTYEAYGQWSEVIEAAPEKMFEEILHRFRAGRKFSQRDYADAWQRLREIRAGFEAAIMDHDAVIMPSGQMMPPDHQRLLTDSDYYVRANLLALRNTRIGNLMGLCAVTLPTQTPSCGFMINGRPNSEKEILAISAGIEGIF